MTLDLGIVTLARFEAVALAVGADPDDLLMGSEELPGGASAPASLLWPGQDVEGVAEPLRVDSTALFVGMARRMWGQACSRAEHYGDRVGYVGGGGGASISLARLCAYETAEGWHSLRTQPLEEAALVLLLRSINGAIDEEDA